MIGTNHIWTLLECSSLILWSPIYMSESEVWRSRGWWQRRSRLDVGVELGSLELSVPLQVGHSWGWQMLVWARRSTKGESPTWEPQTSVAMFYCSSQGPHVLMWTHARKFGLLSWYLSMMLNLQYYYLSYLTFVILLYLECQCGETKGTWKNQGINKRIFC